MVSVKRFFLLSLLVPAFAVPVFSQIKQDTVSLEKQLDHKRVVLPNGWSLTPTGKSLPLGDLPLNMAVSPSGKYLAVTNNGYSRQTVQLFDVKKETQSDVVTIRKSWVGLVFSRNSRFLFVSGGNDDMILKYRVRNGQLDLADSIVLGKPWPKDKISITGIALDDKRDRLYAVTKENNSLYICDTRTDKVLERIPLSAQAYTCLRSPDGKTLYISLWGGGKVLFFDTDKDRIYDSVPTESHPNDMAVTRDGRYLFVANANSNSVTEIDTREPKAIETLSAALYPGSPAGSTTNSVALSSDDKTLYVANADNNCLAVFDVSKPGQAQGKGFIPTGWYPTCVRIAGGKLWIANGKGFHSMANPDGPSPISKKQKVSASGFSGGKKPVQYIAGLFKGTLSIMPLPGPKTLSDYSKAVYKNTPFNEKKDEVASGEPGNPIPQKPGGATPIKYVFYVIKENRTYDQVLGDVKEGNGDPALCIFGDSITPNEHKLVHDFTLLDNFYVDAEVSADGHNWSTAAYATDYVEKTWPTLYSGRGGTYDYEGTRKIAYPAKGFIWDYCKRAGVSYRNYGEFVHNGKGHILPAIRGHFCPGFPDFNLRIQDVYREKIWEHDFDSLVAGGALPRFSTLRFPNDHTSGMRRGAYTPYAAAADNDLGVARFIEHLSHSPIWDSCAVFILEDDAQNGPDHVDAHRSTCYLISPYVKRHHVDHTMYSTSGVLRTMELILGLPPMSQYDAAATPLWRSFTNKPDFTPYQALAENVDINERNTAKNKLSKISATFNLSKEDAIPDLEFNEVIWKGIKGINAVMPAPRHSAFVKWSAEKDDDD
jgi:DNA-binding beta-propeller fold protein YncE